MTNSTLSDSENQIDWLQEPDGLRLDRHIAELVGWREIEDRDWWSDGPDDYYHSERLWGISPRTGNDGYVHEYSTDANAALALLDHKTQFMLRNYDGTNAPVWKAHVGRYSAVADTPALAVCRAFMCWREVQGDAL